MTPPIRVAFVGCGGIAESYLSVYRDLDFVRVVSCISATIESAQHAASIVDSAANTDFSDALSDDIDAVIINTPNALHREQAVAAIRAGKHVLLQKPVASNIADAEAVAAEAEKSPRTIGLYMSYFDQPLVHDLRDMVSRGWFGDAVHFYARLMHTGGLDWSSAAAAGKPNWRSSLTQSGGGCFLLLGVHFIHTFQWISGAKIIRVRGFTRNLHSPGLETEDLACAVMEFDSGVLATLDMAWCASDELVSINGTRGRVNYRNNRYLALSSCESPFEGRAVRYSVLQYSAQSEEQQMEIPAPAYGDASNPWNQHRMFLEAVRDGRPAPVSIRSGVDDMRVVFALYESSKSDRAVEVLR